MRQAEKEKKKKIQSRIPFLHDPGLKITEKLANKFKKLKNIIPALFISEPGGDRPRNKEKKIQSRIPILPNPGQKIRKRIAKKFKKLKHNIPALFPSNPGLDRPRKKKNSHEFRSNLTWVRKFQKKQQKNSKN